MDYSISYIESAKRDVFDIAQYLSQFYESTFAKFIEKLDHGIGNLVQMPHMGMVYKNYRRLVVSDYLVFYRVNEEARTIEIFRILHGSQDIQSRLSE